MSSKKENVLKLIQSFYENTGKGLVHDFDEPGALKEEGDPTLEYANMFGESISLREMREIVSELEVDGLINKSHFHDTNQNSINSYYRVKK